VTYLIGGELSNLLVKTSQPVSVTRRVCSNYADLYPSCVTAVLKFYNEISLIKMWYNYKYTNHLSIRYPSKYLNLS